MKQIEGGVTAAKGYTTAGTRAGIKKGKTNKDMAMIFSEKPAQVPSRRILSRQLRYSGTRRSQMLVWHRQL